MSRPSKLTTKKLIIIISSVFLSLAAITTALILIFPTSGNKTQKNSDNPDAKFAVSITDRFAPVRYVDKDLKLSNIKDSAVKQKIEAELISLCGQDYEISILNSGIGDTISGVCRKDEGGNNYRISNFSYRLSDGEPIQFNDLFISPEKAYPQLADSICSSLIINSTFEEVLNGGTTDIGKPQKACDEDLLNRTLAEFTVDGIQPRQFSYTSNYIVIDTITAGQVTLHMHDIMDNIAIYKRFKSGELTDNVYADKSLSVPPHFVFSHNLSSANHVSEFINSTAKIYVMADIFSIEPDYGSHLNQAAKEFITQQVDQFIEARKNEIEKNQDSAKTYLLVVEANDGYIRDGNDDEPIFHIRGFIAEYSSDGALEAIASTTHKATFGGGYAFTALIESNVPQKSITNRTGYSIKRDGTTGKAIRACQELKIASDVILYVVFPGENHTISDWVANVPYRGKTYHINDDCSTTEVSTILEGDNEDDDED